jgi:hypothetical protein
MTGVLHHQSNRNLAGYAQAWVCANVFYSNIQLCLICNHLVAFLAVDVTWWPRVLLVRGICHGPQGQGDV